MDPPAPLEHHAQVEAFSRRHRTGLVTLVFTDIVGSTALKERLGDKAGAGLIEQHHALVRQVLKEFAEAEEISTAGDSFLILFTKPSDAVKFALGLMVKLRAFNRDQAVPLQDRVGIHLGEVVIAEAEGGAKAKDLHGVQVDVCARVMGLAQAGQILLSRAVFDNARQSLKGEEIEAVGALVWLNHGLFGLKGVEAPVEICEVRAAEAGVLSPPTSSEKAQRVTGEGEPVLGWRPALGQVVPNTKWVLEQKLGEGGFGEVWLGRHQTMKERRVFKFCFRADRVRSLKREMTLFRLLKERVGDHPNIVRLLEVYFDHPPYYVEMDYVDGQDLRTWCEAQGGAEKVSLEVKLEIVAQIADALQAAHDAGVIHRDVKPGNILISGEWQVTGGEKKGEPPEVTSPRSSLVTHHSSLSVKLTDFGIGQVVSEEYLAGVTRAGFTQTMLSSSSSHTGTQLYMAPELLAGKPASTRSDIYSLGVVLYQLLVGDLTRPVATDWANDITEPLLREDLHHCFAGNPQDRFAAAALLAKNLRALPQRQAALAAQQAEVAARERAAYRRGMMRAAGVAAAIVTVVVSLALLALNQSRRARLQAGRAERQTQIAENRAEESRQRQVQVNVASGVRLLNEGQLFASLPWLVEALRLEEGKPEGEDLQRRRLGAVLEQCPTLAQLWFHDAPVNCAAFSPAGRRIATGTGRSVGPIDKSTPGQALVWDIESGQRVGRPLVHDSRIHQLRFSPDGRWIATARADGTAWVWDANSGEPVFTRPLSHSNAVVALAFSRDGALLATASKDGTARVWNTQSGEPVTGPLLHPFVVSGVDFSPDGNRLVTVSGDGFLRLWDAKSGTNLLTRSAHSGPISGVQWSPDGSKWVTASWDKTAKLWDANRGEVLATFRHDVRIVWAAFSPDGRRVVTASGDKTARVWDALTGISLTPPIRHDAEIYYAEFSPDGLMVATASRDRTARVWDAMTAQPLTPPLPHGDEVRQAVFSPDGHRLLTVSDDGAARLWELAVSGPVAELNHQLLVTRLALSPDQRRILTASADGTARVWDLNSGEPVGPPMQHLRAVSAAVFSPDGQRILTTSFDRTARVWEAGTGRPLTLPMLHQDGVAHAAFSPDGRRVATASTDKTAAVWDAATGQRITPPLVHDREVQWVAFSPDGQRLVTACRDRLARVWDATTGKELLRLEGHKDWVLQAIFSPDGRHILTASTDKTARLWDAVSGQTNAVLRHEGIVVAVGFSPDGKRIVTASYDGTARVWDTDKGQAITPPLHHGREVQQATFSSDGRWVVTASWDQTVRLWNATTGDPITPAIRLGEEVRDARLSADGQRLVAASGSVAQVWNLPKEARPVADLVVLAQLLTGQATDAQGRGVSLNAETFKQAWQTLKSRRSELQAGALTAIRVWHRQALAQALKQQQRFAARFHLDRLLELEPGDDSLRRLRKGLESIPAGSAAGGGVVADEFAETRSRIPPQAPEVPKNLIDLSDYYNRPLSEDPQFDWPVEVDNLSSLPRGIQTLAGVRFDLRGFVRLQGIYAKATGYAAPDCITGMKIGLPCRRLHFLHGTGWTVAEGTEIAKYVIHFADGQQSERLVRYGNDVRNFASWVGSDLAEHKDAVRAWSGTNALTAETGASFRLYKSVWENPLPDVPVETMDFISTMSACAPFLIAITAEP